MSKESKQVIKIYSNRLDIYIYYDVERVESTLHLIKQIKCRDVERVESSSIYTIGPNTKYSNYIELRIKCSNYNRVRFRPSN